MTLFTITETWLDVAVFASESFTLAVNLCGPFDTRVVSQLTEYGGVVTATPRLLPSSKNWTEATVAGEVAVAVAVTATIPETGLLSGLTATVGRPPVAWKLAVTECGADIVMFCGFADVLKSPVQLRKALPPLAEAVSWTEVPLS